MHAPETGEAAPAAATSQSQQQQQPPMPTPTTTSKPSKSSRASFSFDLASCAYLREMNKQLDKEEELNERTMKPLRNARLLIYQKELLNDRLIKMYKLVSNNLINVNFNDMSDAESVKASLDDYCKLMATHVELTKLLVNLTSPVEMLYLNRHFFYATLNRIDTDQLFSTKQPGGGNDNTTVTGGGGGGDDAGADSQTENNETTSGVEPMVDIQVDVHHVTLLARDAKGSRRLIGDTGGGGGGGGGGSKSDGRYLHHYVDMFKDIFIKNDHFMDLSTSLAKIIEFNSQLGEYCRKRAAANTAPTTSTADTVASASTMDSREQRHQQHHHHHHQHNNKTRHNGDELLRKVEIFRRLLGDDLILNLCLLRNLCLERSESKLTLVVCRLLDFKIESILMSICGELALASEIQSDSTAFVLLSLLFQIMALLFSKLNTINNTLRMQNAPDHTIAGASAAAQNKADASAAAGQTAAGQSQAKQQHLQSQQQQQQQQQPQLHQQQQQQQHQQQQPPQQQGQLGADDKKKRASGGGGGAGAGNTGAGNTGPGGAAAGAKFTSNTSSNSSFKSSDYTTKKGETATGVQCGASSDKRSTKSTTDEVESLLNSSSMDNNNNNNSGNNGGNGASGNNAGDNNNNNNNSQSTGGGGGGGGKPVDMMLKENECKYKLNKLGISFCKSSSLAHLIEKMLTLMNRQLGIDRFFDMSYFLWLIKFVVNRFVLKNLEIDEQIKNYKQERQVAAAASSSSARYYNMFIFNANACNAATTAAANRFATSSKTAAAANTCISRSETSFLNDSKSRSASRTRKCLLSYEFLSFVVFKTLVYFEQLVFDSNRKNMNELRRWQRSAAANQAGGSESTVAPPPPKLANANSLRILFLSVSCLYELLDCINNHLSYLTSSKSNFFFKLQSSLSAGHHHHASDQTSPKTAEYVTNYYDFISYLNEFVKFEQLKQTFPLLMRFYCYNEHVYSDQLIKCILLTNQLFLNTLENVHEFINQIKLIKQLEKPQFNLSHVTQLAAHSQLGESNSTRRCSASSSLSSLRLNPLGGSGAAYGRGQMARVYDIYANADTSFILKYVLSRFSSNEPALNRCVIGLLDSLMIKSEKREYIFHMNLALSLANIALLDNFRLLDQRTKDLVANMLIEIRSLCQNKPTLANKILFDVHHLKSHDHILVNLSNMTGGGGGGGGGPVLGNQASLHGGGKGGLAHTSHKRGRTSENAGGVRRSGARKKAKLDNDLDNDSDNDSKSNRSRLTSVSTSQSSSSSLSSLRSTSVSSAASALSRDDHHHQQQQQQQQQQQHYLHHTHTHHHHHPQQQQQQQQQRRGPRSQASSCEEQAADYRDASKSSEQIVFNTNLKRIIENEFIYCMNSMGCHVAQTAAAAAAHAATGTSDHTAAMSMGTRGGGGGGIGGLGDDPMMMMMMMMDEDEAETTAADTVSWITSDQIYRIFSYLMRLLESYNNAITSWQVYECLSAMRFDMNDKIDYVREAKHGNLKRFVKGLNIGFSQTKDEFFHSVECIQLRSACTSCEFLELLREAYVKYLIEKMCIKSRHMRSAVFWLFNKLRQLKAYKRVKSGLDSFDYAENEKEAGTNRPAHDMAGSTTADSALPHKLHRLNMNFTCVFELKLINYYHIYRLNIPFIPFTFELQQVFHSIDFSRLLDVLGMGRSDVAFPYLPYEWLDANSNKLTECLNLVEKCLGI